MFNFNNYNPFAKLTKAIANEISTPNFKNWVKCKRDHDIQLVADLTMGAIAGLVQATDYCIEQGKIAGALIGIDADSINVNGLGSAIYKAGRYAYESGVMFHQQIIQGMQSDLLALPQAMSLELQPPSGFVPCELPALPPALNLPPMSYKHYVMMLLGDRTTQLMADGVTKKQMIKALRQGGVAVSDRTRKADVLKLFGS